MVTQKNSGSGILHFLGSLLLLALAVLVYKYWRAILFYGGLAVILYVSYRLFQLYDSNENPELARRIDNVRHWFQDDKKLWKSLLGVGLIAFIVITVPYSLYTVTHSGVLPLSERATCEDIHHKDKEIVSDYFERSVEEWEQVHSLSSTPSTYLDIIYIIDYVSEICRTAPDQKLRPTTEQALAIFFSPLSDSTTCKDATFHAQSIQQQYAQQAYDGWKQDNPGKNVDAPDIVQLCSHAQNTSSIGWIVLAYMDKNGKPQADYEQVKAREAEQKRLVEYHKAKKAADEAAFKHGVELLEAANGGKKKIERCWDC